MILLLLAAAKPVRGKIENRYLGLLESWSEWEKKAVKTFGLYPSIIEILQQFPIKTKLETVANYVFIPGLIEMPELFKLLKDHQQSVEKTAKFNSAGPGQKAILTFSAGRKVANCH